MEMARQSEASSVTIVPVPVLLTRPEAEAKAFADGLVRRFGDRLRPVVAPLMAVDYLAPYLPPGPFAGVIFTSPTGVAAAVRLARDLPRVAWCVGRKTAERATAAGFHARTPEGDATQLVAAIRSDPPDGRLLHLRGEDTRGEVAQKLNSAGIVTESVIIYRQLARPFPPEGRALLMADGPVILPLFSPRSAALFATERPRDMRAGLWLVAMSQAVAEAARDVPRHALDLAEQPDARAMLDAVGRALDRASPP